jgi:hypothetical protein
MGVRLPWQPMERTGAINQDDGSEADDRAARTGGRASGARSGRPHPARSRVPSR